MRATGPLSGYLISLYLISLKGKKIEGILLRTPSILLPHFFHGVTRCPVLCRKSSAEI
jgi:hypothetical protein